MTTPTDAAQTKLVKVKLLKNHTHKGEDFKPGVDIDVSPLQVKWLQSQGIVAK